MITTYPRLRSIVDVDADEEDSSSETAEAEVVIIFADVDDCKSYFHCTG